MKSCAPANVRNTLHETIDDKNAGQRIDNFLRTRLKGVPKERIYRGLRRGEVRVNKGRIRASYKLRCGDVVRIPPLRQRVAATSETPPKNLMDLVQSCVLFEDADVLVLNKPAGIAVHAGSTNPHGVIEALRGASPHLAYLELVHRLDQDTSGCLLIAKTRSSLLSLHGLLREEKIEKSYLVLVQGKWTGNIRHVSLPLQKNRLRSGERLVMAQPSGKSALTHFKLIARSGTASLLEAKIDTGRTHQIRVHAQFMNFPVAGDLKYGDKLFNRLCRQHGLKRMFLHSHNVRYTLGGITSNFSAPLEKRLVDVLDALGIGNGFRDAKL